MSKVIKIKKGLNIQIQGTAEKIYLTPERSETYAVKPPDFPRLMPKLAVKVGHKVKAGTILFFDKYKPDIKFASPVSGEVTAVNRGERRRILEVVIKPNETIEYEKFKEVDPKNISREEITQKILSSGLWPLIRQRPYAIIADPDKKPKAIFISGFDTAPLAPDLDFVVKGYEEDFQVGINVLKKLTTGKIHIVLNAEYPAAKTFTESQGVEFHHFKGPHPAGNVGIQIHHIDPVNKGDVVWYLQPQGIIILGRLFKDGIYDARKIIALTGSEVKKRAYYKIITGASIEPLVKNNVEEGNLRYISGNVLTGTKITKIGHIGFYDNQVSVIPEGNYFEFLGWALPGFNKYSSSRSYWSWLNSKKKYKIDTNLKGGKRALVISGEYEKVLPMDIYPVHLLKAILVEDIDLMEKLGIYEVAEEDFALCEFICTSKINVQSIVRQGFELMIREME